MTMSYTFAFGKRFPFERQMAESIKAQQEQLETLLERYHAAAGNLGSVAKQSR
jgi:hypothetical protein